MGAYDKYTRHYVAVDSIIFGFNGAELNILLTRRNMEPGMGQWSLMGGFVSNKESVGDCARRVLLELTGMHDVYLEQVKVYGKIDREPIARVISASYYALINKGAYNEVLGNKHGAAWFPINHLPQLIFDHPEMVSDALLQLRRRCKDYPIGFN
ncbi:MAG: NUDIX hydrolase, partial [Bacteroidales bacterium]|nr:NUDIX hydrolase [Bacteroidales bacterium]